MPEVTVNRPSSSSSNLRLVAAAAAEIADLSNSRISNLSKVAVAVAEEASQ